MREIAKFNQVGFLSDVMDVDGWESALYKGTCSAISAYFIKLACDGATLPAIDTEFGKKKAALAHLQQQAVTLHYSGFDGYSHILQQIGLKWSSLEYADPSGNLKPGQCALCLIGFNGQAHTIAILYDAPKNLVYTFDPNLGLYESNPDDWYKTELIGLINSHYGKIDSHYFRNVERQ